MHAVDLNHFFCDKIYAFIDLYKLAVDYMNSRCQCFIVVNLMLPIQTEFTLINQSKITEKLNAYMQQMFMLINIDKSRKLFKLSSQHW